MGQLAIVKVLGQGMFGNVYLAANTEKGTLYALKTVTRSKIAQFNMYENIQLERSILMQLDHNMILKLTKTFKDPKRVYFLTEYVTGQDLFDAIRAMGLLGDYDAKFYVSCLIEIFSYLHSRDILYRDLKPENVMVDESGYLKLIDFGTAKQVQGRTYTIVGTPHYMAPEIIIGKGYGLAADWWSMGVILYEFVCGAVPFGEEEEDPYSVYECVLTHRLKYPNYIDPNLPAKKIIETFLDKNPGQRILGDITQLKAHPWFTDIDWQQLIRRETTAPFIPPSVRLDGEIKRAIQGHRSDR